MGVYSGAYNVFAGKSDFSAVLVDSAKLTGAIPNDETAADPITWTRLYTKGNAKIDLENESLDLGDDIRGTLERDIVGEQNATVEIPIADITYQLLVEKFGINPADKSSTETHKDIDGSYDGTQLTGFPLLLQAKKYGTDDGKPKLGTGSDPMSFCFFMFIPDIKLSFELDPKAQRIPVLKGKCVAVDGATYTGKAGKFGTLSALA